MIGGLTVRIIGTVLCCIFCSVSKGVELDKSVGS